jgi:23S rRNA pseudouridine955/2504/2580 synthase
VRVNKGRSKADYRVKAEDSVRVPPLTVVPREVSKQPSAAWEKRIRSAIMYDDTELLVINKPTGLAVHGGSGVRLGLIESLRSLLPDERYLELVHRLDRDTSGLVMIAKNARTLRALHQQLRENRIHKRYIALVAGKWPAYQRMVSAPLDRRHTASGERLVKVSNEGKPAKTEMRVLERFPDATLIEAKPISGRTHQIRVHTQHIGHPILGDTKYQNDQSASRTSTIGLKRLFLHATAIQFEVNDQRYDLSCPLDPELESVLSKLRTERKG